ncbi:nucleotidyltransferase family protein [uncultured Butyricimonas sp.]|uniref:nucleotidyltransferase family protein n=1 Tax=uncultured Butyricimonas sp. TaxID=1268785 RepID=UPI0026DBEF29|nr:nucleotidyltransferase domain-containing protein [uncultured Butyricimonas sp.]
MNTAEVIDILRNFKINFSEKYGIKMLGLLGSFAQKQQKESSDLDVVVILQESDFFTLIQIQEELEKLTSYKVDVVNFRDSLRDSLKANIMKVAIFV